MYHEFCKGLWDRKSYWQEGSLLIHDDVLHDTGLARIFRNCVPEFDLYAVTEIYPRHWEEICRSAEKQGGEALEAVKEAQPWAEQVFEEYGVFTYIGI